MRHPGLADRRAALRCLRWPVLALAAALASGCTATTGTGPSAAAFGPTVAFESVDGPPPPVFERLVQALETESGARSFTVVSREAQAAYRIRSYLSAQVRRGRTTIAWVWDVYGPDQQRALRLSGEEPGGKAGRDAWAVADAQMMRRIARAGLGGLSNMIDGSAPAQEAPAAPVPGEPAVALADDAAPPPKPTTLALSAH